VPNRDPRDPSPTGRHHRPDAHRSEPVPPARRAAPARRWGPGRPLFAAASIATAAIVAAGAVTIARDGAGTQDVRARAAASRRVTAVPAVADTYVVRERPTTTYGDAAKITASAWPAWHTEAYVAFDVPENANVDDGARLAVTFDRFDHRPGQVELRTLPDGWDENGTSWDNRPVPGPVIATVPVTGDMVVFDVGSVVRGPGRYAFAITNPDGNTGASLQSRESERGPLLVFGGGRRRPTASPSPSPTEPDPAVSASTGPSATPSATPSDTPSPDPSRERNRTLCGAALNYQNGETSQQALSRMDQYYGGLESVRLFYPSVPPAWPGRPDVGKRTAIISFKLDPRAVLSGRYDQAMRRWFATAPNDRDVYWVYYHEPEDNIAAGSFSAADYRAAWRRLRSLADEAHNPRLHATLVLMGWTLDPRSGRDWRDYYPGKDVIQALGWDVYNLADGKGRYETPQAMYERVVSTSEAEGLPFGVAETGSLVVRGDDGSKRAEWLRATNSYLTAHNALWVAYFDLKWSNGDYRLLDGPSRQAWRDFC
jgi:hypothetical protein